MYNNSHRLLMRLAFKLLYLTVSENVIRHAVLCFALKTVSLFDVRGYQIKPAKTTYPQRLHRVLKSVVRGLFTAGDAYQITVSFLSHETTERDDRSDAGEEQEDG